MYYQTIQKSLFPDKSGFDPQSFRKNYLSPKFINCVIRGIVSAFNELEQVSFFDTISSRVRSDNMHELIFARIKYEIDHNMPDDGIIVYNNTAGNRRNFIQYGDVIFIVKKDLNQRNDTEITRIIDEQALDKHVITIQCKISKMWDCVQAISFLYIQNGETIFAYDVNVPDTLTQLALNRHINDVEEIKVIEPKLKIKKKVNA